MNAITAPKSAALNRLEGMTLTAPPAGAADLAGAAMLLKLVGSPQIVGYVAAAP